MYRRLLLVVAFAAFLPTCAQGAEFICEVQDYLLDRGNDLMDIFWVHAGAAATYKTGGAHLRISKFWQLGYLRFEGYKIGAEGRALTLMKEKKIQRGAPYLCTDTEIVQEPIKLINAASSKRPVVRNGWFKGDDGREQPWSIGLEVALPPSSIDLDVGLHAFHQQFISVADDKTRCVRSGLSPPPSCRALARGDSLVQIIVHIDFTLVGVARTRRPSSRNIIRLVHPDRLATNEPDILHRRRHIAHAGRIDNSSHYPDGLILSRDPGILPRHLVGLGHGGSDMALNLVVQVAVMPLPKT